MHFIQSIIAIFVLLALVSCAQLESVERPSGPLPPSTRPTYNLSGYPQAVKEGYIDGCETAKETPYGQKDESRYENDGQYRMGWDDGFDLCSDKQ